MVNARCRALLALFALFAGLVFAHSAFADDVIDVVNVTVPVSCSMSEAVSGNTEHTATIRNNEYESDIGLTNIKVFCNDKDGYSVYAIGYSEDTYGNTEMVYQGNDTPAPSNIITGTATSGNTSNWAMKLSAVEGTYAPTILNGFGSYRTVPSTYTQVATFAAQTDNTIGSTIQSTYAIFVSPTQQAGTYQGKVRYTLVHPDDAEAPLSPQATEPGKICYYPNGSNVEGSMGCQTIPASGTTDDVSPTSATLLASNFSRAGYGFAGWSTTFDYSDDTGYLGPQEDITFTAGQYTGSNPGLSLYARWIKSAGSLQNWSGCSSLQSGAVTALTDQRDNETYAVAKLADGNCWMIENMRLENTGTDNTNGSLAQGYNASFAGLADPEAPWANDSTTANSLYSIDGSTDKTISGSNLRYRFPRYNNVNTPTTTTDRPSNPTSNSATNSTTNASMYSYGNYYTWAAAIADTTDYTSGDHDTTSICPTGWKIPLGYTSTGDIEHGAADTANRVGSFSWLDRKMGGTGAYQTTAEASLRWRKYPNNFVYSGGVGSGSVYARGSNGGYWSSTAYSSDGAYNMLIYSSGVYPGTYSRYYKYNGRSIRCVASGA